MKITMLRQKGFYKEMGVGVVPVGFRVAPMGVKSSILGPKEGFLGKHLLEKFNTISRSSTDPSSLKKVDVLTFSFQ